MASTFIRTIIIYVVLTVSMRLMGKREIGELEVGELVSSLLLSEICSIPIDNPDIPLLSAIIPVFFIVSMEILIPAIKNRSGKLKKLFEGEPSFLIYKGSFNQRVLNENRISIEEFFTEMRTSGIGSIDEIEYCIIEANGKISILKKNDGGGLGHLLISDGEVNQRSMAALGYSEEDLKKHLGGYGISDIFLLSVNDLGDDYMILKDNIIKKEGKMGGEGK